MTGRELSGRQKLEIIRLFFRGEGYAEIAQQTDTSKGSVHNVVNELRDGRFPDIARPDEIDLLRVLSASLKKAGLDVYRASIGLISYERLRELGIEPPQLKGLVDVLLTLKPDDVSSQEFIAAALHLRALERATDQTYETMAREAEDLAARLASLRREVKSLTAKQADLKKRAADEKRQVEELGKERRQLQSTLGASQDELRQIDSARATAQRAVDALAEHVRDLEARKGALRDEIEPMKSALERLKRNGVGVSELRRLVAAADSVGAKLGASRDLILERLFGGLDQLDGVTNLERKEQHLEAEVRDLDHQVASLRDQKRAIQGEIASLEGDKAELRAFVTSIKGKVTDDIRLALEAAFAEAQQASQNVVDIAQSAEAPLRQTVEWARALSDELRALEHDASRYEHLTKLLRFVEDPLDLSHEESIPLVISLAKNLGVWAEGRLSPAASLLISYLVSTVCAELERSRP